VTRRARSKYGKARKTSVNGEYPRNVQLAVPLQIGRDDINDTDGINIFHGEFETAAAETPRSRAVCTDENNFRGATS